MIHCKVVGGVCYVRFVILSEWGVFCIYCKRLNAIAALGNHEGSSDRLDRKVRFETLRDLAKLLKVRRREAI